VVLVEGAQAVPASAVGVRATAARSGVEPLAARAVVVVTGGMVFHRTGRVEVDWGLGCVVCPHPPVSLSGLQVLAK
jgi:hypothetical protein